MFGSQILEIVIGLVFIYLILSLLATSMSEFIMRLFVSRGKHLRMVIDTMLGDAGGKELSERFFDNPTMRKFSNTPGGKKPSYLSSKYFSRILLETVSTDDAGELVFEKIEKGVDGLPEGDTKEALRSLIRHSQKSVHQFQANLETWYDDMMDRASGWYKRKVQLVLVVLGLIIAVVVNADTFQIATTLANDPAARKQIVEMAIAYTQQFEDTTAVATAAPDTSIQALNQKIKSLINNQIASTSTVLGMGWSEVNRLPDKLDKAQTAWWFFSKFLGWVVTAFAISLGSTFWFDLLKKLINIRNAGKRPEPARQAEAVG